MCELFEVAVTLLSNTATQGIVNYSDRKYLIELGWLTHIRDNLYCIHIGYLISERRTFV